MESDSLHIAASHHEYPSFVALGKSWVQLDSTCHLRPQIPFSVSIKESGYEGIKVNYGLFTNDFTSGIFLLVTVIYCFVMLRSKKVMNNTLQSIFGRQRERSSLFEPEITANEARYGLFIKGLGFLGLTAFIYSLARNFIELPGEYSSLIIFVGGAIFLFILLLFKYLVYAILSYVFIGKSKVSTFADQYLTLVLGVGVILFPLILVKNFIQPELFSTIDIVSISICIIGFLVVFYKIVRFFRGSYYSIFYFILYLCTLEILPLLIVVKLLHNFNIVL
jgi:hypothetical protein